MDQSSEESGDSKESALNNHGNASSKTTKHEKRLIRRVIAKLVSKDENEMAQLEKRLQKQVNNVENLEKTRAKSVSKGTSERCRRSSPNKTERSKSMARSGRKSEFTVTTDRSETSERKEGATFHTKITNVERDNFITQNLGVKARYSIKENLEDKMSQDRRRNGRSRSRSGEKDNQHGRKRWREESMEYREHRRYKDKNNAEAKEDSNEYREYKRYTDKSHGELRKDPLEFGERKMEIPCKYFNDVGFCKYNSGHPDLFGNRRLHICDVCYYERGLKRDHSHVDCNHSMKETTSRNGFNMVDDACSYFNNGDCWFKSGSHVSRDGKYVRLHICGTCFKYGEKRSHPAIECKYNESLKKYPKDSTMSEIFEPKAHNRHGFQKDEKPCNFFNIYGNCRYASGHYPSSGRFTKQLHICSCCREFLGEARNHPAIDCDLKKVLVGERKNFVMGNSEVPCNSFNSGNCDLKSGHRIPRGDLRVYHICKFCAEYRGEKNYHSQEECKLRKKLLQEVKGGSQSSKKDVRREEETGNDTLEINNSKEITEKKSFSRFKEESIENSKEGKQTAKVMPKVSQPDRLKESEKVKMAKAIKVCLIKRKTLKAMEKCSSISPCRQTKPKEEAINQTESKIDKVVKHDMKFQVKNCSNTGCLISVDKDLEDAKQDTSIEADGEKVFFKDANPPKTFLKNNEQESGHILSGGPSEDDHRKLSGPPLLPRNQFHPNSESETNNEEPGNKRRKMGKSTQAVTKLDGASDTADKSKPVNAKEKEKYCDKGLLPVDDVLKSLNGEVLQIDPETKMDVNDILKKLEQLENLHTIEVEKLRKARQHNKTDF